MKSAHTGIFSMVRIFPHSDWKWRDTEYLSVFNPNMGKYGTEKLRIWTLFMQWNPIRTQWLFEKTNAKCFQKRCGDMEISKWWQNVISFSWHWSFSVKKFLPRCTSSRYSQSCYVYQVVFISFFSGQNQL